MPINPRRRTLAAGVQASMPPASSKPGVGGGGSVKSGGTANRRVPKSRKSMIPRCAGTPTGVSDAAGTHAGRRVSGLAAPSPTRGARRPCRQSLGGPVLPHGSAPTHSRRASLALHPAPAGVPGERSANVDPRDVKDKAYLQNAIRKMVVYLTVHGYRDAAGLSVKQLVHGPSGRDFQNIMTFLFRRIDPTFHPPAVPGGKDGAQRSDEVVLKFEDEVAIAYRCLGYPFPVSKTGLVAVGSPHTWPALVAAIDWLVELLTIRDGEETLDWGPDPGEEAAEAEEELLRPDGSATRADRQFHVFLRKSMVAFLRDDNEECMELEGALLDEVQRDSERVEAYLTGLDEECRAIEAEISRLKEGMDGLSEAQQKQEEYAESIEKFHHLIQTLNDHKAELTDKAEKLAAEKAETEQQIADGTRRIHALRVTVSDQKLSMEDVRRMEREVARVNERIAERQGMLVGHTAALVEAREKWQAVLQLLEQSAEGYNAAAQRAGLAPAGARHAGRDSHTVAVATEQAGEGLPALLGGVDLGGVVGSCVEELAREYEGKTAHEQKHISEATDQIESAKSSSKRVVQDIEAIKDTIEACRSKCAAIKVQLDTGLGGKRRELDLCNAKIASLDHPEGVKATVAKYDAEYARLQQQHQEEEEKHMARKRAVAKEIRDALEKFQEYEDDKKNKSSETNAYIDKKREECANIRLLNS